MLPLIINKKELSKALTQGQFLTLFDEAIFVNDYQDKLAFTLNNSILTIAKNDYTINITVIFKHENLYIISFSLPSLINSSDRQFVKSEYLKLKSELLSLNNDITNNVQLQLDGSSIKKIHLAVWL